MSPADESGPSGRGAGTGERETPDDVHERVRAFGDAALLVDLESLEQVQAVRDALVRDPVEDLTDVVPAARTVLLLVVDGGDVRAVRVRVVERVRAALAGRAQVASGAEAADAVVEIPVVYDGADLHDVAAWAGLTVAEVVARHSGQEYRAAFSGFMPGFTYLTGVDPRIAAPRRSTPRTSVPAGSVALAGDLTAVYPASSPGGWQLLGRTSLSMFDVDRDPPALVPPGARVRFVPVPAAVSATVSASTSPAASSPVPQRGDRSTAEDAVLEVLSPGMLTLVQDAGRPGRAALGVSRSGAADRASFDLANRLVANPAGAAALELTFGGLALRFRQRATVAVAGAPAPMTVDGTAVGMHAVLDVPAGAELRIGLPTAGLRTYVALRGGVRVPQVLGSSSTDVLSGIGPPPLAPGTVLGVGEPPEDVPVVEVAPVRDPVGTRRVGERPGEPTVLEVMPGVRGQWFGRDAFAALGATFVVSPDSNRVALRLSGPPVPRSPRELPSEGLVRGAVQVPPDGQPVLFLADHPVTGGYPVIAVLTSRSADRAAQRRPGDRVALRFVGGNREPPG
ncbi:5-oxoprolinase subunit PxpB [Oerskovia flava]|uniref:5-oxoprolinase subunit PxpB n=1 Tax=Oerskovia flava TaxID=2986422 RepID=UPI0022400330|nr:5-oxoprolinase subunit PxpB [Oerskovia sp. JB1-3-2]